MRNHAVGHPPLRLAASAGCEMALLRLDDAAVTLRQTGEAGVAIALTEAFFGQPTTGNTMNAYGMHQADTLTQQLVQRQQEISHRQGVLHRRRQCGAHFLNISKVFRHTSFRFVIIGGPSRPAL